MKSIGEFLFVFVAVVETCEVAGLTLLAAGHAGVGSYGFEAGGCYGCAEVGGILLVFEDGDEGGFVFSALDCLPVDTLEPWVDFDVVYVLSGVTFTFMPRRDWGSFLNSPSSNLMQSLLNLNS